MSRVLSELLGAPEPAFTFALQDLELQSGVPGIDIRLQVELTTSVRAKLRELGLDPRDTTARELYHGLQAITALHDTFLAKFVGGTDAQDAEDLIPKIIRSVQRLSRNRQCWVLKHSVAKRLVRAQPPKNVMKHFGYKSVDSMLKRENIGEIYAALRIVESPAWLERFVMSYKDVSSSDFEKRDIEILGLSAKRWRQLADEYMQRSHINVTHLKELGVIAVLPLPSPKMRGVCITIFPILIHYMNEIRLYSAFFKLSQVRPDFADSFIRTLLFDPKMPVSVAGQRVHWRILQRHFGRLDVSMHPEVFEPHVQPEDLHWQKAEEQLYKLEPALKFWAALDYVALPTKSRPVSLNLLDNAINFCNQRDYEHRVSEHFKSSLWNELYSRYLRQEALEQHVLSQLSNDLMPLDMTITTVRSSG